MRETIRKNLGNFRQCGNSPTDLSALLFYKFRSATKMYLPSRLKRNDYNSSDIISPLVLAIETTSKCNASCIMCARTTLGFKAYEPMRDELLTHEVILDLIEQTPHTLCRPAGFGEPLLDSHLPEYIRIAHDNGKLTRLVTNASLLSRRKAHALMDAGLDHFVLSIDACDVDVYEEIRRGLAWERTRDNVMSLKDIRNDYGYWTYIQMNIVINSINEDKIETIMDYWYPYVDIFHTLKEARHWKDIKEVIPPHKCFGPWEAMLVLSDGDVPACCKDVEADYVFGNVLESSSMEVWNSREAQNFRKQLLSNDPPKICLHCEVPRLDEYFPDKKGKMRSVNTAGGDLSGE